MFRKLEKFSVNLFTALGMLAVMLVVLFLALSAASNVPVVGGVANWFGQHANGSAEGF